MNKQYMKYLFKSKKNLFVVVTILYFIAYGICFIISDFGESKCVAGLVTSSFILGILSYVLVPLVYSYVHNKKAVDSYFSLPVTRKEMLITSQLFIDLTILIPFIILSIVTLVIGLSNGAIISVEAYIVYVLEAIIGLIVAVLFQTAIFLEANSTFDGVVLMGAYLVMPLLIYLAIETFQSSLIAGFMPLNIENLLTYVSLPIGLIVTEIINGEAAFFEYASKAVVSIALIISIVWHIVVSIISLRKNYINRKVERAETISNNFFSYPFVIYFYVFSLVLIIASSFRPYANSEESIVFYFLIFVCFMIATFIYRRKIQIKIKDVLFFVLTILIVTAFTFVSTKTKGFGLSYVYNHDPKNIAINYISWNQDYIYENASEDEMSKLIKKVYPDYVTYNVYIEGFIYNDKMTEAKEVLDIIEENRLKSIDKHYSNTGLLQGPAYLEIITNYDEDKIIGNNFEQKINYESKKDQTSYDQASRFAYDEILKLSKFFDVYVEILTNDEQGYVQISLNNLIEKTQS